MTAIPETTAAPFALWKLIAIGLAAGLLSGLFGVGGGVLIVPALVLLVGIAQRTAHATSLAAVVPISIVGAVSYIAAGHTDLELAAYLAIGTILGALVGVRLLQWLPEVWLRWLFIAFMIAVAVRLFFEFPSRETDLVVTGWTIAVLIGLGVLTGVLAGLLGVGGGIFMVPVLIVFLDVGDLTAKGVSLLVMIPTGIIATIASARKGNVDVRASLAIGLAGAVTSLAGAALAWIIDPRVGAILFAVFLLIIVGRMILQATKKKAPPAD